MSFSSTLFFGESFPETSFSGMSFLWTSFLGMHLRCLWQGHPSRVIFLGRVWGAFWMQFENALRMPLVCSFLFLGLKCKFPTPCLCRIISFFILLNVSWSGICWEAQIKSQGIKNANWSNQTWQLSDYLNFWCCQDLAKKRKFSSSWPNWESRHQKTRVSVLVFLIFSLILL